MERLNILLVDLSPASQIKLKFILTGTTLLSAENV
jgi:hypothetical protein